MTRVLVVDDSPFDRLIHRRWLEGDAAGAFAVSEAATAEAGVDAALRTRFDCVLMDYVLPGGDGLHAVRAMRAAVPDCPPIILLTCALTEDMRRNALALGAAACLCKPVVSGEALTAAIREAIAEKEAADAPTRGAV